VKATVSTRKALAIVLSAIVLTAVVAYVFAASSNIPITIGGGIYPGAPDYTVWREGNNYFAKNASGVVEFSGTNATQVIRNAMQNAENNGGGTILLKAGIYECGNIDFCSNVDVKGEGISATILIATGTYIFRWTDYSQPKENITICDLTLKGSTGTSDLIYTYNDTDHFQVTVKNLRVINVRFTNFYAMAFHAGNVYNLQVINCIFDNPQTNADSLAFDGEQITVRDCQFVRDAASALTSGGAEHVKIVHNYFNFTGADVGGAIRLEGWGRDYVDVLIDGNTLLHGKLGLTTEPNNKSFSQIIITNNYIYNASLGLNNAVGSGATYENVLISNNYIEYSVAFALYGAADNITISDNIFVGSVSFYEYTGAITNLIVKKNHGFTTENSGTATITASTTVTFNHGLAGTPDVVLVGWQDTGYGTWSWSANSTHITITVTNSGTYDFSWYAEYKP